MENIVKEQNNSSNDSGTNEPEEDRKEFPLNLVKIEEELTPIPEHEVHGLITHASTYPIWEPKLPLLSTIVPDTVLPNQLCQIPPVLREPAPWQEVYNVYVIYERTNTDARNSYQRGSITFGAAQRLYMQSLFHARSAVNMGALASCYLDHLIKYGLYYQYINEDMTFPGCT